MWEIEWISPNYYIVHSVTRKAIKIPDVTRQEWQEDSYQRYFDKAYVACQKANGQTVYLTRHVNGKIFTYRYTPKSPKKG